MNFHPIEKYLPDFGKKPSRLTKAELDIARLKANQITPSERRLLEILRHREELR